MSISKAVISGAVVKNPEKRFTTNNLAITSFTLNIGNTPEDAKFIRVVAVGKLAESLGDKVKKDSMVVVEGRLITSVYKTNTGAEKKTVELEAQSVEVVGVSSAPQTSAGSEAVDSFDFSGDFGGDELIGEDEIPF